MKRIEKLEGTVRKSINKYSDRFPKSFNFSEFKAKIFTTGCIRSEIEDLSETLHTIDSNNHFKLYFKIPELPKNDYDDHLFVLINGFNEPSGMMTLYYSSNHSLSRRFADLSGQNIGMGNGKLRYPSVLLPIPFHHWRRPVEGEYQEVDSETMIYNDPIRLYLGFRQLLYDAQKFITDVKSERDEECYNELLQPNPTINILGYSIGGLGTLSVFLFNKLLDGPKFSKCFLLASGVNLLLTDWKAAKIHTEVKRELDMFYYSSAHNWRETLNNPEYQFVSMEHDLLIEDLFERVVLGYIGSDNQYKEIDKVWADNQSRINYVVCESDEVMYPELIKYCVPNKVVPKEIHILKQASHWLAFNRIWMREDGTDAVLNIVREAISN